MGAVRKPDFLQRHGMPGSVADLARFSCLAHLSSDEHDRVWRFPGPGGGSVSVDGLFHSNSAIALRKAALAGLGIALVPEYCIAADLDAGALVRVLPQCEITRSVMALYARSPHIPQKIRLLVSFLAEWFRQDRAGSLPADRRLGRCAEEGCKLTGVAPA